MERDDLYVRIGPRKENHCLLTFRWRRDDFQLEEVEKVVGAPRAARYRADSHVVEAIATEVRAFLGAHPGPFRNLLLDIRADDLYSADWETLMRFPPNWSVTRFHDVSSQYFAVPFELPARLFLTDHPGSDMPAPTESSLRYFRTHRVAHLHDADVLETIERGQFDIVHVVIQARWPHSDGPGPSELTFEQFIGFDHEWIKAKRFRNAVANCRARLVVMKCMTPDSYEPALDLSHRVFSEGSPTVIVVEGGTPMYLDNFYMAIVHNLDLASAAFAEAPATAAAAGRVAFLSGVGGADVLQIAPMADQLLNRASRHAELMDALAQSLSLVPTHPSMVPAALPLAVSDLASQMHNLTNNVYNYSKESGAWIPLAEHSRELSLMQNRAEELMHAVKRVVNVGMLEGEERVSASSSLQPDTRYEISVQIGPVKGWSIVAGGKPIPEAQLMPFYAEQGTLLRVLVFAPEFSIPEPESFLFLPRPPHESPELRIALRTPKRDGGYRVRIAVYHENNLLQSLLMRVVVSQQQQFSSRNIIAEVEYALTDTLADPERLPPRTVNFLTNEGDDGTHTFVAVGTPFRRQFDFSDTDMKATVGEARQALFAAAADSTTKPPKYRFDDKNSATINQLEQDVARLAELGWSLYTKIVVGEDRDFERDLQGALGKGGATIQISATRSAQYVFPWALIYDHPVVSGRLSLCPVFAQDLARLSPAGQTLDNATCLSHGCPHHGDTSIVCPSGFWGFKHLIEQPLSVASKSASLSPPALVLELNVGPASQTLNGVMAISRKLTQVGPHMTEIGTCAGLRVNVADSKAGVAVSLQMAAKNGVHLVYFYCHGGRERSRTWLGIGIDDRLVPGDLKAWALDWSDLHPLVFINGCHTVDITPDDLLNFNQMFAYIRAAGVVGTEIDVPETLARDFACGFFTRFAGGATVGEALKAQRLDLLARCNPLGLAYTPYCSSSLHVVHK